MFAYHKGFRARQQHTHTFSSLKVRECQNVATPVTVDFPGSFMNSPS